MGRSHSIQSYSKIHLAELVSRTWLEQVSDVVAGSKNPSARFVHSYESHYDDSLGPSLKNDVTEPLLTVRYESQVYTAI